MKSRALVERGGIEILEIFQLNNFDQKRPSKWITYLYMPIQGSVFPKQVPTPIQSTLTEAQLREEEARQAAEN
jgi:hypothetical protein